jgi:hypothetical protein
MFITFHINHDQESRHPLSEPAQWVSTYSQPPVSDARSLRTGDGFHCEDEGRKEEGCGRPMRKVRLMATTYRPLPENLRPEESLSEAS